MWCAAGPSMRTAAGHYGGRPLVRSSADTTAGSPGGIHAGSPHEPLTVLAERATAGAVEQQLCDSQQTALLLLLRPAAAYSVELRFGGKGALAAAVLRSIPLLPLAALLWASG